MAFYPGSSLRTVVAHPIRSSVSLPRTSPSRTTPLPIVVTVEPHEVRPPRVMIAIHVDPEVRDQLRAIAYEQKVPLRGLVCAGLNAVFAQHHKPEIAR